MNKQIHFETDSQIKDRKVTQTAKMQMDKPVKISLQFRLATNGVIVNTLVNDKPVITTGAGSWF